MQAGPAGERRPGRWTTALLTPAQPRVWDVNLVRVERLPRVAPARAVAAEADALLGGAGLSHRRVICDDEAAGRRLAPGLEALGWRAEVLVLMAWADGDPPPATRVEWPDGETLRPAYAASHAEFGQAGAVLDQLVEHAVTGGAGPGMRVRHGAIRVAGTWAATLRLYDDGATAEIDDVTTLRRFRGRGLGRELVLGAVGAARAGGCDLVVIRAEERDWPAGWYRRLGFRALARSYVFTRS